MSCGATYQRRENTTEHACHQMRGHGGNHQCGHCHYEWTDPPPTPDTPYPSPDLRVYADVYRERRRQDAMFGGAIDRAFLPDGEWLAVLTEETGEVARWLCERNLGNGGSLDDLRTELIQVAAVAVAWVESMDAARDSF